jgi:hypothetical protein
MKINRDARIDRRGGGGDTHRLAEGGRQLLLERGANEVGRKDPACRNIQEGGKDYQDGEDYGEALQHCQHCQD